MPVTLADWTVPTGRIEVAAALINPDSANVLYRDDTPATLSDTQDAGELADGTLEIAPNYYISRIISAATQQIQLHDNPNSDNIGSFFAAGGAGHDLRIHAQNEDASGYFDVNSATVASANPQRVRWTNIPANFYQVISDAGTSGTPFILAFTREDPNQPPAIAFTTAESTVDGRSVTTISGTVSDPEDPAADVTVTAAATLGTASAVTNTAGAWSFTLTAPAVAAAAQDMSSHGHGRGLRRPHSQRDANLDRTRQPAAGDRHHHRRRDGRRPLSHNHQRHRQRSRGSRQRRHGHSGSHARHGQRRHQHGRRCGASHSPRRRSQLQPRTWQSPSQPKTAGGRNSQRRRKPGPCAPTSRRRSPSPPPKATVDGQLSHNHQRNRQRSPRIPPTMSPSQRQPR